MPYGKIIVEFFGSKAGEIIGKGLYRDKRSSQAVLGSPTTFWEVGWGGVEVEVDPETGEIKLLNYVSISDVGKAINKQQVEGQIEGCLAQALGYALLENFQVRDGKILTPHLSTYLLPTALDMPTEIVPVILELADPIARLQQIELYIAAMNQ